MIAGAFLEFESLQGHFSASDLDITYNDLWLTLGPELR